MHNNWNRSKLIAASTLPFAVLLFYLFYSHSKKKKSPDTSDKENKEKEFAQVSSPESDELVSPSGSEELEQEPLTEPVTINSSSPVEVIEDVIDSQTSELQHGDFSRKTITDEADTNASSFNKDAFLCGSGDPTEEGDDKEMLVISDTDEPDQSALRDLNDCNGDSGFQSSETEDNSFAAKSLVNTSDNSDVKSKDLFQEEKKTIEFIEETFLPDEGKLPATEVQSPETGINNVAEKEVLAEPPPCEPEIETNDVQESVLPTLAEPSPCEPESETNVQESVLPTLAEPSPCEPESETNNVQESVLPTLAEPSPCEPESETNGVQESVLSTSAESSPCAPGSETNVQESVLPTLAESSPCEPEIETNNVQESVLPTLAESSVCDSNENCLNDTEPHTPLDTAPIHNLHSSSFDDENVDCIEQTSISDENSPVVCKNNDEENLSTSSSVCSQASSLTPVDDRESLDGEHSDAVNESIPDNLSTAVQLCSLSHVGSLSDEVEGECQTLSEEADTEEEETCPIVCGDIPVSDEHVVNNKIANLTEENVVLPNEIDDNAVISEFDKEKEDFNANQEICKDTLVQLNKCQSNEYASHNNSFDSPVCNSESEKSISCTETSENNLRQGTDSNADSSGLNVESESLVSSSESVVQEENHHKNTVCGNCLKNSEKDRKKDTSKSNSKSAVNGTTHNGHMAENGSAGKTLRSNTSNKEVNRNTNNNNFRETKRPSNRSNGRNERLHKGVHNGWNENASSSSNEDSLETLHKKRSKPKKGEKTNSPEKGKEVEVFVEFPNSCVGLLIGKQGRNIKQLKHDSGAEIFVHETEDNEGIQVLQIRGTQAEVESCVHRVKRRFKITLPQYNNKEKLNLSADKSPPSSNHLSAVDTSSERAVYNFPHNLGLLLPKGKIVDVAVSAISNVDCVFLQQYTDMSYNSLNILQQHMEVCYADATAPSLPRPVVAGFICVVEQGGVWYRAQVCHHFEETDDISVRFLDYGGYGVIPFDSVKQIREDMLNLPFQAAECYLDNITPIDDDVERNNERIVKFQELLKDGVYKARVTSYKPNACPIIQLYKFYGSETKLINSEVVKYEIANWAQAAYPVM